MNILTITFNSIPNIGDGFLFKVIDPNFADPQTKYLIFVNLSQANNVYIANSINQCAENFFNAFNLYWNINNAFTVNWVDNKVFITSVLNYDFIDIDHSDSISSTYGPSPISYVDFIITNPYPKNKIGFTLDNLYYQIQTTNLNTYFEIVASIKTFAFFEQGNIYEEKNVNFKLVPFQGKSKIALNKVVHRLMQRFIEPNEVTRQYKQSILSITVYVKLLSTKDIIKQVTLPDVFFLAGLAFGFDEIGFLDFNKQPNRVTKNGYAYLNMVYPQIKDMSLIIYRNDVLFSANTLVDTFTDVIFQRIDFNEFTPGDKIECFIAESLNALSLPSKVFFVFPEGKYSNFITWENQYLLQTVFEFTGSLTFKPDLEWQTQKLVVNDVEFTEILDTKAEGKFIINTGWIMQSDVDTIYSLLMSKKAWITRNNKTIRLIPQTKSMISFDSERELVEYSIEFLINKNYNEETYSC